LTTDVKICGLQTREAVEAALSGGARFTGFVFFPPSPRSLTPAQAAPLTAAVPKDITRVGLFVDADDDTLAQVLNTVGLDMVQFHGHESPERVAQVHARFGLPVMKAVSIAGPEDVTSARAYEKAAQWLLFDAKPPRGATRPGGNALAFDWELIRGETWNRPWMLAGGLDAGNLVEAVRTSGARTVDVSSGVEDGPGIKNPDKIRSFLALAKVL
jgi:phosphoribosylanthranilate isomerase